MNMRWVMSGLWMLAWLREKLLKAGVSAKDLQWVDFTNKESLNQLAQKIVPWLLRSNPEIAQQIKESGWLDWKTKQDVVEIVDNI
jgi:hypothetical protein